MKVIGINGSSRRDGNTASMIRKVFEELDKEGIETELIQMAGHRVRGCTACGRCALNKDGRCVIEDDIVNGIIGKMAEADGMILGSPVYFSNVTPEMKALIDRVGRVARANDYLLERKVGAAVTAVRRGGALSAFNAMNSLFLIEKMIVPGSTYWNLGIGRDPGDVEKDIEGMENMKDLGRNMAWLIKKLK
ncbi:MAG: flavodoxin family protein [Candidatus Thermoplasmatota archaeon]|nr:flavodoxin family protein [Candidatus Thermoplasmatota archaeon]